MGDPGLRAENAIDIAVAHGAGLHVGKVGAGIRLGEDRGRQHRAGGDIGKPARLLRLGAAAADQFAGDLGAGAERADADIGARQFLGNDAHRGLSHAEAAMLLGQRHAEHADRGQFVDHLDRDQPVGAVPLMRERRDGALGETADLISDHFEGRVVERIAPERRRRPLRDQRRQTRTRLAEPGDETRRIAVAQRRDLRFRQAEIGGAYDFRLRHRDAAGELRQIFSECDPQDQRFAPRRIRRPRRGAAPIPGSGAAPRHRSPSRRSRVPRSARGRSAPRRVRRPAPHARRHAPALAAKPLPQRPAPAPSHQAVRCVPLPQPPPSGAGPLSGLRTRCPGLAAPQ